MSSRRRRYGKYRGTVMNNIDPMGMGRVQVSVSGLPDATSSNWAMPCVPVAGVGAGIAAIPPIGAMVWVEFEQGDMDHPIWVGGFWQSAEELPATVPLPQFGITMKTPGGNKAVISDAPGPAGGIVLETATGASLVINATGIHINNGQGASITLVGPVVSINKGALEVI